MPHRSIVLFLRELKQRRVYRVALAYGIAGSALVQIGGTVLSIFHASEWVQQLFVVILAVGFPIALMLAWAFDITAAGIERTPNVRGLYVTNARQIWILGFSRNVHRCLCVVFILVLAPVAIDWQRVCRPNECKRPGKKYRGLAIRKFEHGKGERVFHERRAGRNPYQPRQGFRSQSDQPLECSAIQDRRRAQPEGNRPAAWRRLYSGRLGPAHPESASR